MILFDADAIYILHWGTTKERNFIRSFIQTNKTNKIDLGITTYTLGEIYRIMLDTLVCVYNLFLKKYKEIDSPSTLNLNEIFDISSDMIKALLPGKNERRKSRIKGLIHETIFNWFKNDLINLIELNINRNPLKTIIIQLYNNIINFNEFFLDQRIFQHIKSKIQCQWVSYEVDNIPLDFDTPFPIVGWGCSRFGCNEKQIIQNWAKNEYERVERFIEDLNLSKIRLDATWINSLILLWGKLHQNPPDLKNIYTPCKNLGDFFLILDAKKEDYILSSNTRDFKDACVYFNIGYTKIEREITSW